MLDILEDSWRAAKPPTSFDRFILLSTWSFPDATDETIFHRYLRPFAAERARLEATLLKRRLSRSLDPSEFTLHPFYEWNLESWDPIMKRASMWQTGPDGEMGLALMRRGSPCAVISFSLVALDEPIIAVCQIQGLPGATETLNRIRGFDAMLLELVCTFARERLKWRRVEVIRAEYTTSYQFPSIWNKSTLSDGTIAKSAATISERIRRRLQGAAQALGFVEERLSFVSPLL